jgi:hypothetical protein
MITKQIYNKYFYECMAVIYIDYKLYFQKYLPNMYNKKSRPDFRNGFFQDVS